MKSNRFYPAIALLLALLVGCKPSKDISGAWLGTLDAGHLKLRLVLRIKPEGNSYKATIDSVDQGRRGLPASGLKVKGADVHVDLVAFQAIYDAKINATGTEMTGFFKQSGMNIPFTMKKTSQPPTVLPPLLPAAYAPRAGSELQGYWQGVMSVGNVHTRLGFKISEPSKEKFRAELDNIDHGVTGIPVTTLAYESPKVHMDVIGVAGVFDGTLRGNEITGTWQQGPNNLPIVFKKSSAPATELANYKYASDTVPQGVWNGSLDANSGALRLVLKIGKLPDGNWAAKLDSPDQGANDIPASNVRFTAPSHLDIEWKAIDGAFSGELKDNKLVGNWAQTGRTFPLTLERNKNAK